MAKQHKGWHHERYRHGLASRGIITKEVAIRSGDYPPTTKRMHIKFDEEQARDIVREYMGSGHYLDPNITTKMKLEMLARKFEVMGLDDLAVLYYADRAAFATETSRLGYGKVMVPGQVSIGEVEKKELKQERKQSAPEHQSFAKLSKTNQRKLKLLEKAVPGALFQVGDVESLWNESDFDGRNHLLHRASAAMKTKRMKYKKSSQAEKDAVSRAEEKAERGIYHAEMQRIKDVEDKEDY